LKFCSTQCQKTSFKSQLSGRKTELLLLCQTTGSLNKTLKQMGFPGARGVWYRKAKNILDNVGDK
jgi:molybdenum-dependent DNA-binding transcriptional regulator ModE